MASRPYSDWEGVAPQLPRIASIDRREWRAAALLIACVLGYGLLVFPASGASAGAVLSVFLVFAAATGKAAALVLIACLAVAAGSPQYRRDLSTRLLWLAAAAAMTALTFPFFGLFKQLILPARGFVWDSTLAQIGRALTGGTSPWVLVHALFGAGAGLRLLNFLYTIWLVLIFAFPMVVGAFVGDSRLRLRLLASWFAAWVLIGTVGAWCFASAGPCYYNALVGADPSFAEMQRRLAGIARAAAADGHPIETIEFQPFLLKAFYARIFAPGGGISAMPSMHVALATLCAIAGFARGRALGLALTGYAVLIWLGSIYFGWHYMVDGPVAALMMIAVWKASGLIVRPRTA